MKEITIILEKDMPKIQNIIEAIKVFLRKNENYQINIYGDEKSVNFIKNEDNVKTVVFDDNSNMKDNLSKVFQDHKLKETNSPIINFGDKDVFINTIKTAYEPIATPALLLPAHTKLFNKYTLFLDCGASTISSEKALEDFYKEGLDFEANALLIKNPKIAMLESKYSDNKDYKEFSNYLKENAKEKFVGEISSQNILEAKADIVIADSHMLYNAINASIGTRNTIESRYNDEISKSSILKFFRWNLKSVNKLMIKLFDTGLEVNGYYLAGYSFDMGLLSPNDGYKEMMNCFDFIHALQIKRK